MDLTKSGKLKALVLMFTIALGLTLAIPQLAVAVGEEDPQPPQLPADHQHTITWDLDSGKSSVSMDTYKSAQDSMYVGAYIVADCTDNDFHEMHDLYFQIDSETVKPTCTQDGSIQGKWFFNIYEGEGRDAKVVGKQYIDEAYCQANGIVKTQFDSLYPSTLTVKKGHNYIQVADDSRQPKLPEISLVSGGGNRVLELYPGHQNAAAGYDGPDRRWGFPAKTICEFNCGTVQDDTGYFYSVPDLDKCYIEVEDKSSEKKFNILVRNGENFDTTGTSNNASDWKAYFHYITTDGKEMVFEIPLFANTKHLLEIASDSFDDTDYPRNVNAPDVPVQFATPLIVLRNAPVDNWNKTISFAAWSAVTDKKSEQTDKPADTNKDTTTTQPPAVTEDKPAVTPPTTITPAEKDKWVKGKKGWWYRYADGTCPKNGRYTISGKTYYFDNDGWMKTGWQQATGNSDWYYFGGANDGVMKTSKWIKSGKNWFYLGENGKMYTGKQTVGGKTYHFADNGAMTTGWKQLGSDWYYFGGANDGVMKTSKWIKSGLKWYYLDAEGKMATGTKLLDNKRYYFTESGAMVTGWKQIEGLWYYFGKANDGVMKTNKWIGNYWVNADGYMSTDCWVDNDKYYVDANGKWVKGKKK